MYESTACAEVSSDDRTWGVLFFLFADEVCGLDSQTVGGGKMDIAKE